MRNSYKILGGMPEEKRSLRRPGCKWDVDVKMYRNETGSEGVDWIQTARYRGR
jgi:hypothetical protein